LKCLLQEGKFGIQNLIFAQGRLEGIFLVELVLDINPVDRSGFAGIQKIDVGGDILVNFL